MRRFVLGSRHAIAEVAAIVVDGWQVKLFYGLFGILLGTISFTIVVSYEIAPLLGESEVLTPSMRARIHALAITHLLPGLALAVAPWALGLPFIARVVAWLGMLGCLLLSSAFGYSPTTIVRWLWFNGPFPETTLTMALCLSWRLLGNDTVPLLTKVRPALPRRMRDWFDRVERSDTRPMFASWPNHPR